MNKIGKYKIVGLLGEGAMGTVYKARDPLVDRFVAIKVLDAKTLQHPHYRSLFYREARSAGQLSHQNITVVYEIGEDRKTPYLVMEYLEGVDLELLIQRKQPISILRKLEIANQVCEGLRYAHLKNVIHRDIKPANIRVLSDGVVKIMDFGIARFASSSFTTSGVFMGSPFYMSPEQITGGTVDSRTDIFSFGILLFELLTYRMPFSGENPNTVMYKIIHDQPEWDNSKKMLRPAILAEITDKCLAKELEFRYENFSEVIVALNEVITILNLLGEKEDSTSTTALPPRNHSAFKGLEGKYKISPSAQVDIPVKETRLYNSLENNLSSPPTFSSWAKTYNGRINKRKPNRRWFAVSAVIIVLLFSGGIYNIYHATPGTGNIALNVIPWAEIVEIVMIRDSASNEILWEKDDSKILTPCFFTLPVGSYSLKMKHPELGVHSITFTIEENQLLRINKKMPGYSKLLNTFKF